MNNILDEYLVKIGAQLDTKSFNGATRAISQLAGLVGRLGSALTTGGVIAAFAKLGDIMVSNIKTVADLDLQYQKLAKDMWVTKETAKSLQQTMEIMGASEDDIAWVPELREQFFRLREEMNKFATPADADSQLRWIRDIGYDIQSLQAKFAKFREWLVYYLIKYLEPYITQFRQFVQWLNEKFGEQLPQMAKKLAYWLSRIASVMIEAGRAIGYVVEKIYYFIDHLPSKTKAMVAAMAAAGAIIMAGPFGMMLAGIGAALLMLEDFMYYMDGKKSSKTLAPMWKMILDMGKGDGVFGKLGQGVERLLNALAKIVNGVDFKGWLDEAMGATGTLLKGLDKLSEAIVRLGKKFKITGLDSDSFFKRISKALELWMSQGNRYMRLLGEFMRAIGELIDGNVKAAASIAWNAIQKDTKEQQKKKDQIFGGLFGSGSASDVGKAAANITATEFSEGEQWMGGRTSDSRIQCDSFTAEVYNIAGVGEIGGMSTDGIISDQAFRNTGAYHEVGDGYEPQVGDLVDFKGHVGIYMGNGEMISRQSSMGVHRVSIAQAEEWYGALQGYGSIGEATGNRGSGWNAGSVIREGSYADSAHGGGGAAYTAGFAGGNNYTTNSPTTFGNIIVNVGSSNATPGEIATAVRDKIMDAGAILRANTPGVVQ